MGGPQGSFDRTTPSPGYDTMKLDQIFDALETIKSDSIRLKERMDAQELFQIVYARVEMTGMEKTGRTVERDRNYFPEMRAAPEAKAGMWLKKGTDVDVAKARGSMAGEGYSIYKYPLSEGDPLGKARRAVLSAYKK